MDFISSARIFKLQHTFKRNEEVDPREWKGNKFGLTPLNFNPLINKMSLFDQMNCKMSFSSNSLYIEISFYEYSFLLFTIFFQSPVFF